MNSPKKTSFSQLPRACPGLAPLISCKASRKAANFGPASCKPRWMACRMSLLFREPHVGETCMLSWWNPAAWIILDISDINFWMPTGSTHTPLFLVFLPKGSYTPCGIGGIRLVATFALEVCSHKGPGFVVEERNIYGSLKKDGQSIPGWSIAALQQHSCFSLVFLIPYTQFKNPFRII
jgi:hypothetical protein